MTQLARNMNNRLRVGVLALAVLSACSPPSARAAGAEATPDSASQIEQRIGRIDRIGQMADTITIWNLFYADTIGYIFETSTEIVTIPRLPLRIDLDALRPGAALLAMMAHDFILGLPGGYDAPVGQRGANLSGGQRQRIAIARALLVRPAVLILDDSTSAVDVETEARIQDTLEAVANPPTRIVIAQRISTVMRADRILVLEDGRIVAEGTHAELLAASPIYRDIHDSQLGTGTAPA